MVVVPPLPDAGAVGGRGNRRGRFVHDRGRLTMLGGQLLLLLVPEHVVLLVTRSRAAVLHSKEPNNCLSFLVFLFGCRPHHSGIPLLRVGGDFLELLRWRAAF